MADVILVLQVLGVTFGLWVCLGYVFGCSCGVRWGQGHYCRDQDHTWKGRGAWPGPERKP